MKEKACFLINKKHFLKWWIIDTYFFTFTSLTSSFQPSLILRTKIDFVVWGTTAGCRCMSCRIGHIVLGSSCFDTGCSTTAGSCGSSGCSILVPCKHTGWGSCSEHRLAPCWNSFNFWYTPLFRFQISHSQSRTSSHTTAQTPASTWSSTAKSTGRRFLPDATAQFFYTILTNIYQNSLGKLRQSELLQPLLLLNQQFQIHLLRKVYLYRLVKLLYWLWWCLVPYQL